MDETAAEFILNRSSRPDACHGSRALSSDASAFGGLSRKYGFLEVVGVLDFKSDEERYLIDEIKEYIREAKAS